MKRLPPLLKRPIVRIVGVSILIVSIGTLVVVANLSRLTAHSGALPIAASDAAACSSRCFHHIINAFFQLAGFDMVVIRLARGGAKKRPFFNIVVADSRNRRASPRQGDQAS